MFPDPTVSFQIRAHRSLHHLSRDTRRVSAVFFSFSICFPPLPVTFVRCLSSCVCVVAELKTHSSPIMLNHRLIAINYIIVNTNDNNIIIIGIEWSAAGQQPSTIICSAFIEIVGEQWHSGRHNYFGLVADRVLHRKSLDNGEHYTFWNPHDHIDATFLEYLKRAISEPTP